MFVCFSGNIEGKYNKTKQKSLINLLAVNIGCIQWEIKMKILRLLNILFWGLTKSLNFPQRDGCGPWIESQSSYNSINGNISTTFPFPMPIKLIFSNKFNFLYI